ncbi:Protein FAM228A [Lemmus lemmus]
MDTYFQHQAVSKEIRKEMLHKKWVENVVRPLQQRIIEKVISYRRPGQSQVKYEYCLKHTNKQTKAAPKCECLFRRQQELREAKGAHYQHGTGKQKDTQKEPKGTRKAPLFRRSPKFMLTSHGIIPKERQRASAQTVWNKPRGPCSSEKLVCTSKSHLPQEEKTCSLSQIAFERQFRSSKLSPKKKEAEKGPVSETRPQRPRSWAAADNHHSQGPPAVGRRVMTAELLGKHLASLQGAASRYVGSASGVSKRKCL